jgi:hypothetical protein
VEVKLVVLTVVVVEEWWLTVNGVWLQELEVETSLRV